MLYIDVKYASMLSPFLKRFKKKNDYLWNYRCNVCGDSAKNEYAARAYIYRKKQDLFVRCHNCGYGTNLGNLIKLCSPTLYKEYVVERYLATDNKYVAHNDIQQVVELRSDTLDSLLCVDDLGENHPVKKYVNSRKIPKSAHKLIYYTTKFKTYINEVLPGKFPEIYDDHPRLMFPYFNNHGHVFAFSARAFGDEQPKYYTIKLDDNYERIYGMERVNFSKRIYAVEGPIDSLFIPNTVAVSGASFDTLTLRSLSSNLTLISDNEPRNKEIHHIMKVNIERGYSLCIWPDTVAQKDINEMVLAGMKVSAIKELIDSNTYSGTEAMIRLNAWKKRT